MRYYFASWSPSHSLTHLILLCHDCDNYHFDLVFAYTSAYRSFNCAAFTLENTTIIARCLDRVRNPPRRCERANNTVCVEKSLVYRHVSDKAREWQDVATPRSVHSEQHATQNCKPLDSGRSAEIVDASQVVTNFALTTCLTPSFPNIAYS